MNRLTRREFLSLTAASAAGLLAWSQAPAMIASAAPERRQSDDELFGHISAEAEAFIEANDLPGMAYGILRHDQMIFSGGCGICQGLPGGQTTPMTAQTVQCQASVSKSFAGAAIMQLVEAGLLNVDLPVIEYLPYFQLDDPRSDQITTRHLLGHSSGLPFVRPEEETDIYAEYRNDYWYGDTPEGYVRSLTDINLLFDPGAMFSYSDTGYDILADAIEKVSGQAFPEYCKEHIFDPLGMAHSTFRKNDVNPELIAEAYDRDIAGGLAISPVFPYSERHWPSSCLFSNIEDLARWMMAHLNHGKLGQSRILQAADQKELWDPLTDVEPGIWYGWGWWVGDMGKWFLDPAQQLPPVMMMLGGQIGVQSAFVLEPKSQLGVLGYAPILDPWNIGGFVSWALAQLLDGKCCRPLPPVGKTRFFPPRL